MITIYHNPACGTSRNTLELIRNSGILWGLAFTQFGGTKNTARIAKIGFFAGILLPAAILVILAVSYLHSGAPLAIEMNASTFFPDFTQMGTLVVFVAFILSYMGVEASATHVNEMKNPGRDYPLHPRKIRDAQRCTGQEPRR